MNIRLIFIILLTIALTIFFMQNSEPVTIKLFFDTMTISKLALLPGLALFGFLAGYIFGRSGRRNAILLREEKLAQTKLEDSEKKWFSSKPSPLSAEDEDYLKP